MCTYENDLIQVSQEYEMDFVWKDVQYVKWLDSYNDQKFA